MRFLILLVLSLLLLASCYQPLLSDEELMPDVSATSSVRIITRSAEGDELFYPLHAYAFATDGHLLSHQQFNSSSEALSLSLPQQTEARIVILSADPDAYDIPSSPTLSSVITPRIPTAFPGISPSAAAFAKGFAVSPLQMGFIDVRPLTANTTVSIPLHYQVASLNVQLSHLPVQCTSAYVAVASPAQGITINGALDRTTTTRVPLTKVVTSNSSSVSFATSSPVYLLPTSGNTTFTIAYNDAEGEQYASTTYLAPLRAGTPYQLQGSYSDGSLILSGSISPSEWNDPIALNFTFANGSETTITPEAADDPDSGTAPDGTIPQLFTTWNGHLVVGYLDSEGIPTTTVPATVSDGFPSVSTALLLMSLSDWSNLPSALNESNPTAASTLADDYTEYGLTNWRIPTEDEARYLSTLYRTDSDLFDQALNNAQADPLVLIDSKGNNLRYLCAEAKKTYSFKTNTITNAGATIKTYHLRLVRTVQTN